MSIMKQSIATLLVCSFVLFSCKGEVTNTTNKVKEAVESEVENLSEVKETTSEIGEDLTEEVAESNLNLEEKNNIVAPSPKNEETNSKPEAQNSTSIPKPKSTKVESKNDVKTKVEEIETPVESVPSQSSTQTKTDQVLKEIEKPVEGSPSTKVEVGKITKPSKPETKKIEINNAQTQFGHSAFGALLKKVVSASGDVDYALLKANRQELDAYCKSLEENPPSAEWSKNEKLAYWLNAYNAFTLRLIVDNYPLSSITDLEGGKPWDKKWINLDNQSLSLNDIENVIIRPRFKDARIHFAVNCAAKSCPPLANYAFTARNVEGKLEGLTKSFINSSFNEISENKIVVSKIFDWYKEDFGNLIEFINRYSDVKVDGKAKVRYQEYDWRLNGK